LLDRTDIGLLKGAPLSSTLPIAGPIQATIRLKSIYSGPLVVKLVDVRPDGEVRLVRETPVTRAHGRVIDVRFSPIAYRFDAGSRPGLMIAGSSFPAWIFERPATGTVDVAGARLVMPDASLARLPRPQRRCETVTGDEQRAREQRDAGCPTP
jgi:predicted acyl esterase